MNKKTLISTRSIHKKKLRELRIKKLAQRLKSNIIKRKKNKLRDSNGQA